MSVGTVSPSKPSPPILTSDSPNRGVTRLPIAWRQAIAATLATRALFFTIAYAAQWLLAGTTGPSHAGVFAIWNRYDATQLIGVARFGYTSPLTDPHASVYFPLYPLLIRALIAVHVSPLAAGLAISTVASCVAFFFLFKLAAERLGEDAASKAILYLALFPTAVFLVAPYVESLFLAGATGAFFYARRGRWGPAGIAVAVATASRAVGVFLVLGLIAEFIRQRDLSRRRIVIATGALAAGSLPVIAYVGYLWHLHGTPLYFLHDEAAGWERHFVGPLISLKNTLSMLEVRQYPTGWIMTIWGELAAAVAGLALLAWTIAKKEWGYAVYVGATLAVVLSSTWYYSLPRLLLALFPLPIMIAELTAGHKSRHDWVMVSFASFAVVGVVVFTSGHWFY
ncbi:MAG: hypothetical protein M3P18_18660 [Actinomycetota bacterium]|nr:hypothetical protein [Actinomycetota bacterium]